jgi:hypothetical protein
MADKKGRASNTKLDTALAAYNESNNQHSQKDKFALKCLRDAFSESLKISSASSYIDDKLSHTVTFAVTNGRHEDTLTDVTICESIEALKAVDSSSLASVVIHKVATNMALELLGFEIEAEAVVVAAPVVKATTDDTGIKEQTTAPDEATQDAVPVVAKPTAPVVEATNEEVQPETPTSQIEEVTEEAEEPISQTEASENTDKKGSHTEELAQLIENNKVEEPINPTDKVITPKAIAKIIDLMRKVDLSQDAIISRLRNTSATNISEMTMGESHRIANWLKKETKDSRAIVSKREKFGGFDVGELNESQKSGGKGNSAKKAASKDTKAPSKGKKNEVSPQTEKDLPKAPEKAPDAATEQVASSRTPDIDSPDVKRALKHFEKEAEANDRAPAIAAKVLDELTSGEIDSSDVPTAISLLTTDEMKKFRSAFAKALFSDRV